MSGIEICEAEACWAEGWLQKTVTIATLERVQGPLTKDLTPDSFSTRVVELDSFAYGIIALQIAVVLIHELYALNNKPLLANHEKASSNWVQLTYLFNWFQMFFVTAMTVPVSLDFCMQLGQSAAMSGFYLSSPILGSIVGIVIGKMMTSEVEWNQPLARRLMIFAGLIQTVCGVGLAAVVNDAAHYGIGTRRTIFWIVILLMQVSTVIGSIPCVPMLVMQAKLTPTSEKTFWMILAQCARNAGMLVGPGFFAVVALAVKQGQDVSPGSLLAWVYISEMMVGMTFCIYSAMALPTYIAPMTEDEVVAPETEVCVSVLEPPLRERVVKNMVLYSLERPFSIAAIEVGTIMLLEVSYGWSTELCGTAFTVVAGASLVFSAISSVLLSRNVMTESFVFFAANMCGLLGVLFLFDFGTGAAGLLIADGLVYGMASVANGIAEGWGTKAAMPGTGFSVEIYRLQNTIAVNSSRFVSPIVARTLLDFGGRNVYACLQLLVVFLGTMTVYKTVRLVWDHEGEAKPLNSNKAEKLQNEEITVSNT